MDVANKAHTLILRVEISPYLQANPVWEETLIH